jgi:hypothetical protein
MKQPTCIICQRPTTEQPIYYRPGGSGVYVCPKQSCNLTFEAHGEQPIHVGPVAAS